MTAVKKRRAPSKDPDRDTAWGMLADAYESITGERPVAYSDHKKDGAVDTAFVHFVQAVMCTQPGENPVSGDQVRRFLNRDKNRASR